MSILGILFLIGGVALCIIGVLALGVSVKNKKIIGAFIGIVITLLGVILLASVAKNSQNDREKSDEGKIESAKVEEKLPPQNIDELCLSIEECDKYQSVDDITKVFNISGNELVLGGENKYIDLSKVCSVIYDYSNKVKLVLDGYEEQKIELEGIELSQYSKGDDYFYLDNPYNTLNGHSEIWVSNIRFYLSGTKNIIPVITLRDDTSVGFEEDVIDDDSINDKYKTDLSQYNNQLDIKGDVVTLDGEILTSVDFCESSNNIVGKHDVQVYNWYYVMTDETLLKGRKLARLKSYADYNLEDVRNVAIYLDITDLSIDEKNLEGKLVEFTCSKNNIKFIDVESTMIPDVTIAPVFRVDNIEDLSLEEVEFEE